MVAVKCLLSRILILCWISTVSCRLAFFVLTSTGAAQCAIADPGTLLRNFVPSDFEPSDDGEWTRYVTWCNLYTGFRTLDLDGFSVHQSTLYCLFLWLTFYRTASGNHPVPDSLLTHLPLQSWYSNWWSPAEGIGLSAVTSIRNLKEH